MGEILDAGREAKTCLMVGKGMNGLEGIIVCYNHSNSRYTLELENGDMMSLRARNVRAIETTNSAAVNSSDTPPGDESQCDLLKGSVLRKEWEYEGRDLPSSHSRNNMNFDDRYFIGLSTTIMNISPSMIGRMILLSIFGMIWVDIILRCVGSIFLRHISRLSNAGSSFSGWHFIYGSTPSSLACIIAIGFIAWQFGTKTGTEPFQWKNILDRIKNFSVWEVLLIAAVFEFALRAFLLSNVGSSLNSTSHHIPHYPRVSSPSSLVCIIAIGFFAWQFGTKKGITEFRWSNILNRIKIFNVWEVLLMTALFDVLFKFALRVLLLKNTRSSLNNTSHGILRQYSSDW